MIAAPLKDKVDIRENIIYPLEETRFHKFFIGSLKVVFSNIMELDIIGLDNIPKDKAAILAANHVTNMDVFPMQLAIRRPIFYMSKAELFRNPLMHTIFRQLGAFPVYRGGRDEWALMHAKRILHAGNILGIFPEGTRSKGRGLKVAKTGAARLAMDINCPIIPMSIDGSYQFFKRFPRKSIVKIVIGDPILAKNGELPIGLTERLMYRIAENLPVGLRGVYR